MPTKHMISPGIGFSPGHVKYIVTRGLSIAEVELGLIDAELSDSVVYGVTLTDHSTSYTVTLSDVTRTNV